MKDILVWGLIILSLGLSGMTIRNELYDHPEALLKRTKASWYVGCITGSIASGVPPELVYQFCDGGYEFQDFQSMGEMIEDTQDIFFQNHK